MYSWFLDLQLPFSLEKKNLELLLQSHLIPIWFQFVVQERHCNDAHIVNYPNEKV